MKLAGDNLELKLIVVDEKKAEEKWRTFDSDFQPSIEIEDRTNGVDLIIEALNNGSLEVEAVFEGEVSADLVPIAKKAGIYQHVWHPDELKISRAKELISPIENAIKDMDADMPAFEALNGDDEFGTAKNLKEFLGIYLDACNTYPKAHVRVMK